MATPPMHKMAYPVETPEAQKFWASKHVCNRVKAIISFSRTEEEALRNLRRFGFDSYHFRKRALDTWSLWLDRPEMTQIPFTPMNIPWWECLSGSAEPGPNGRWATWVDTVDWTDTDNWVEWIPDPIP